MPSNKWTEDDMQDALKEVANGKSQRQAYLDWGIGRGTLQGRISGILSNKEAHKPFQRLSKIQEQHLTNWVLLQETLGQNAMHSQIRTFAGRILT